MFSENLKVARNAKGITKQHADKARGTRRYVKIIITIFCVILCLIVIYTMLQFIGTGLHGEISLTPNTENVVPIE